MNAISTPLRHVPSGICLQVLPPLMQCVYVLDMSTSEFGFVALDSLPSMPLALFELSYLEKNLFLKMQPGLRTALLEGLLTVINWTREVINGYGLTVTLVRCV
jgi:hypothetical protein